MGKYIRENIEKRIGNLSAAYKTGWIYDKEKKEPGSALANCMIDLFMDSASRQECVFERYEALLYNYINVPCQAEPDSLCYFSIKPDSDLSTVTIARNTRFINSVDEDTAFRTDKDYDIAPLSIEQIVYINEQKQIASPIYDKNTKEIALLKDIEKNNKIKFITELTFINVFDNIKQPKFKLSFYNENGEIAHECMKLFFSDNVEWSVIYNETEFSAEIVYYKDVPLLYVRNGDFTIEEELIFDKHEYILKAFLKNADEIETQRFCIAAINLDLDYETPEVVIVEDELQNTDEGFYLFGNKLDEAGNCYISSNVFGKSEFEINMKFTVDFEIMQDEFPQYEKKPFKLIMTSMPVEYDYKRSDCKVRKIKTEYFNGTRWTEIDNSELICKSMNVDDYLVLGRVIEKKHNISFIAPSDWVPCVYDGETRFWLRIRAVEVINENEPYKMSFVPIVKNLSFLGWYKGKGLTAIRTQVFNGIESVEKRSNENIPAFLKYTDDNKEPVLLVCLNNKPPKSSCICISVNNLKEINYEFMYIDNIEKKSFLNANGWWFAISMKSLGEDTQKIEKIYLNVVCGILEKETDKEVLERYIVDQDFDIKADIDSITRILPVKTDKNEQEERECIRRYLKSFNKIVTRKDLETFLYGKYKDIEQIEISDSVNTLLLKLKIKEQPQKKLLMSIIERNIRKDLKENIIKAKTVFVEWGGVS